MRTKSKTMAFCIEGRLHCIACTEKEVNKSDYPHLFLLANPYKLVDADTLCTQCKKRCDNRESGQAGDRLADMLEGKRKEKGE